MKNVLNLQLLNGNVIKYQDKSEIKAELISNEKMDLSGLTAEFILKRSNEVYVRERVTVSENNTVSVVIDPMPVPRTYIVEVVVDGKYFFPSDNKVEMIIERSSVESTEVPPKEREQVADLIKHELSGMELSGIDISGGTRTDIAYCKAIGKPLGEKVEMTEDNEDLLFTLESGKPYHLDYEFSDELKSLYFGPSDSGIAITLSGTLVYEELEEIGGTPSDDMIYNKKTDELKIIHPNERTLEIRGLGLQRAFNKFDIYPLDLDGETQFSGFTTSKAYDDLGYPYIGFRQTEDEEVSQTPEDYSWVCLDWGRLIDG